jgi:hypothetical protein
MGEKLIKIKLAAEYAEVSERTIYYWIEHEILKLAKPGYVYESDLRRATLSAQQRRNEKAKQRTDKFDRDENGRFRLLSGDLNNKRRPGLL